MSKKEKADFHQIYLPSPKDRNKPVGGWAKVGTVFKTNCMKNATTTYLFQESFNTPITSFLGAYAAMEEEQSGVW